MNLEETQEMFKQKILTNFADMSREEILDSLVSHVTSRTRQIQKWETKGMESKGKDKREWIGMANSMRDERQLITRLHINIDKVLK